MGTVIERMADKLIVGTPVGELIVTVKADGTYPGVTVDFKGKSGEEAYLAMVEYDADENAVRTHVYGDKYSDVPTASITHKDLL